MIMTRRLLKLGVIQFMTTAILVVHSGSVSGGDVSVVEKLDEELKWLKAETYVWSASKYEQKTSEAPSLVSVVTSDEIKKFGYRKLSDVLQRVSGFYINSDRTYTYAGVRGFRIPGDTNTKIQVMIDGHRINDNVFHMGYVGTEFPLDIDLIDRVEITRGPGSCLYGGEAFFGVINVITKKTEQINGPEISAATGSMDTYKGRLSYGAKITDAAEVLVSASAYDSKGKETLYFKEYDDPATNNGVAENLDGENDGKLFLKTSFGSFMFTGCYSSRTKDSPIASYGAWFNHLFDATDKQRYAELKYDYTFNKDTHLFWRGYYDRYTLRFNLPYEGVREDGTPYISYDREKYVGEWAGSEIRLTTQLFGRNNLTVGAEYQYNIHENMDAHYEDPWMSLVDSRNSSAIWAVYLQDELRISDQLILNAGVRYDHYESFGGTTNPRIALIYTPFSQTAVKLVYGTAFRAPTTFESYSDQMGHGIYTLDPETITTYEAILEQRYGTHLQGFVSGFYYKIDGLITAVPFAEWSSFENKGDVTAKGIEAEIRTDWESGLSASVNYTFQDVRNDTTDQPLPISPKHLIKANVSVPLMPKQIFLSSEGQYMSSQRTLKGNYMDSHFVMNATLLGMNIVKKLEISCGVYNLFDKRYSDPGSTEAEFQPELIEQNGRTFRLKLTYSF